MNIQKSVRMAGVALAASLIWIASASAQPRLNPMPNGDVSVDMYGCSVLFDSRGVTKSQGNDCTSGQLREARNAFDSYRREQGGSDNHNPGYSAPSYGGSATNVTCESMNNQYQYCRHHVGRNGNVTIARQLSSTRCNRGQNWDFDDDGVWVEGGCRAVFHVESDSGYSGGGNYGGRGQMVTCESLNNQYQYCRANVGRNAQVTVQRQISNTSCVRGRNWDYDNNGIWVNGGCRATFEVR